MSRPQDESFESRTDRQYAESRSALDDLTKANASSNATMMSLIETVHAETQARDRKIAALERNHRQLMFLSFAVSVAVVLMLLLGTINAVNLAQQNEQQAQIKQINATLLDCVNSTGVCAQANAEKQAQILDSKRYQLTGFYCIRTNPADEDPKGESFLKCMKQLYPGGPELEGRWP